ncbi:hypothetical protein [Brevibacillus brevis]|uniref:hypothetical protein n=1 Tax=Brevibacillus brevis TaxID=1393 RepID=UPI000D0F030B|nr:hypothetical protein C7J99_11345 [Brevibacillus brevis]RED27416.1 hypothetical protein DES34_110108 [Brevibacillus brevis]GEC90768.1 hypothetical protein BBR01nite_30990 [Brevibacillus brevis]VEF91270.1 Uncharacterised protein [Brevibacillus brevis]
MPSCDEQIILEELNQFPEQILSRERSQAILKGVREEGGRLQKVNKRRMYYGWMAKGLITCGLLLGFFWMKPFSTPAESTSSAALTPEEQKYFTAAQQAITTASGIEKNFPFEEIEKNEESFAVQTKDDASWVLFKPDTTEVIALKATFAIHELTEPYHKYVETARNAYNNTKQPINFETAEFVKRKDLAILSFELEKDQDVNVDLSTNKVLDYTLNYNPKDADQKSLYIAQKALTRFSKKNGLSFTLAIKSSDAKEDRWTFHNEHERYSVEVGAQTGQVYDVQYVTDHIIIKSIDEAIPVTKPLIQDIFGIDTTGYKAYGGKDWGGYILRSDSPGKPRLSIKLFDRDVGTVYGIGIERD